MTDTERAADATEVETESPAAAFTQADADAETYQHVDLATTDGSATATGWITKARADAGNILDVGDGRAWIVVTAYDGFILTGEQMKRLPPGGYITDTYH